MATNSPEMVCSTKGLERSGWRFAGWIIKGQYKKFIKGIDVIVYDKKSKLIVGHYQLRETQ